MSKILVTGASGFVGRYCVARLLQDAWDVHCLSKNVPDGPAGVTWHQANLLDPLSTGPIVRSIAPTHLLHLAWHTTPGVFWNSGQNLDWVEASIGLIKVFHAAGGQRLVIAGSCAEYDWSGGVCDEESTPLRPSTTYGQCKHATHLYAQAFCEVNRISLAWPRLFYLYGPNCHPQRFPGPIISALLRGMAAPCSHGKQVRDYLHIRDAGAALAALVKSDLTGAVNVASGTPVRLSEILLKIADQLDGRDLLGWGEIPSAATEPLVVTANTRRLNDDLGWRPSIGLEEGLANTIAWWKERRA